MRKTTFIQLWLREGGDSTKSEKWYLQNVQHLETLGFSYKCK